MISRIVTQNGNKVFEIAGKTFIPAAFRSFRPTPANVSLFYRNGLRLFQMQCTGLNNTQKTGQPNYLLSARSKIKLHLPCGYNKIIFIGRIQKTKIKTYSVLSLCAYDVTDTDRLRRKMFLDIIIKEVES